MALPKRKMCFWPAKTRKHLDFFEMHTSLEPCAQNLLRHRWRKMNTASFHFHCVSEKSCIACCNEFLTSVSGFRLKFSRIALLRKHLQLDSKSDLTTNGLILGFFGGKWLPSLNSYLYWLKSARIAQLLFFFDDINFFQCLVRGVFWSVL